MPECTKIFNTGMLAARSVPVLMQICYCKPRPPHVMYCNDCLMRKTV